MKASTMNRPMSTVSIYRAVWLSLSLPVARAALFDVLERYQQVVCPVGHFLTGVVVSVLPAPVGAAPAAFEPLGLPAALLEAPVPLASLSLLVTLEVPEEALLPVAPPDSLSFDPPPLAPPLAPPAPPPV